MPFQKGNQLSKLRKNKHTTLGRKLTEEHKNKIRLALKGNKNPLGYKWSEERKIDFISSRTGNNHPMWKGDKVKYKPLHAWVRRHLPKPDLCVICKITEPNEVSNISGKYLRDLNDYRWLCWSCHRKMDGAVKNFKK